MNAIFIFTKDRPNTLDNTLQALANNIFTKYVIDDSVNIVACKRNMQLISKHENTHHINKLVFDNFVRGNSICLEKVDLFLRPIGLVGWNLGYARNFALFLAKAMELQNVLFVDDDITVHTENLVLELFTSLDKYQFSGSIITGQEDDSIIGHITRETNILQESLPSGGFLSFNTSRVQHYFLNNYNEDWIWQLLNSPKKNFILIGAVFQVFKEQFETYKDRIIFQETGEIIVDGILDELAANSDMETKDLLHALTTDAFWADALEKRISYLHYIRTLTQNIKHLEIFDFLFKNYFHFTPQLLSNIFAKYSGSLNHFNTLYNNVKFDRI